MIESPIHATGFLHAVSRLHLYAQVTHLGNEAYRFLQPPPRRHFVVLAIKRTKIIAYNNWNYGGNLYENV